MGKHTAHCIFAILLSLITVAYFYGAFSSIHPASIHAYVSHFGGFAPLIFLLIFTVSPIVPFFSAVLAIAGGLIFGFPGGSALVIFGAMCSGTLGFYIARNFSQSRFFRKQTQTTEKIKGSIEKNGFLIVLILRLIPLVPFDIISYGAGFSAIGFRKYIAATFLGMIPGVLVYVNIGSTAIAVNSKAFHVSIALLILLSITGIAAKGFIQRKYKL